MTEGLTGWAALGVPETPREFAEPEELAAQAGARIAAAREQAGLTAAELGEVAGLSESQMSRIESGRRRADIAELPLIAAALGVTVRELLGMPVSPLRAVAARLAAGEAAPDLGPARRRARQLLELEDLLTEVTGLAPAVPSAAGRAVMEQARSRFRGLPHSGPAAQRQGEALAELARRELDLGSDALGDVAGLIEQHFAVDVALSPAGTGAAGLRVRCGRSALILASSDLPDAHLRGILAHQLGHVLLGDSPEVSEETIIGMAADTVTEQRASAFAGHFLMPEPGLRAVLAWQGEEPGRLSDRTAVLLTERFGVTVSALAGQLTQLGIISGDDGVKLRSRGTAGLLSKHPDAAPSGAGAGVSGIRRVPDRLARQALAAARREQLGLSAVAALLEREDDELLWAEVTGGEHQQASAAGIAL